MCLIGLTRRFQICCRSNENKVKNNLQLSATLFLSRCQIKNMTDEELIKQVKNGNAHAFRFLVSKHQNLVLHIAGRIVQRNADLEDVCQDVFLKVYQHIEKFKGDCKLSTWIATIAYNSSISYLRKFRKSEWQTVENLEDVRHEGAVDYDVVERSDLHRYIRGQIEFLPLHYRTVLTLYHLEEFSYQDIEKITGMPEGTIKSYLFRARKLLKEKLKSVADMQAQPLEKEVFHEK